MTAKALLQSAGDGTAVPTGYVGEIRSFTNRTIAAVTSGFTSNASVLDTLPSGRWHIITGMTLTATSGATFAEVIICSNSNNDNTGTLSPYTSASTTGLTGSTWTFPCNSFVLDVASSQALYAKAQSYGANRNVTVFGYAIRIA